MKKNKYLSAVFILIIFIGFSACSSQFGNKPLTSNFAESSSAMALQALESENSDSNSNEQDELAKIYTQAIATFIDAAYKKDKISFDTLYFGKHVYGQADDFPDIQLPTKINQTQIRLVSPEIGQKKQSERKSLYYVNMMGWVEKDKAEFMLVVFTNGGEHQFDYIINFISNKPSEHYLLDKIAVENYLELKGQKPKRVTIFQDGKYDLEK